MDFEWDEAKAASNVAKHEIGFDLALRLFLTPGFVEFEVSREGDGERRWKLITLFLGRHTTVVFTRRGERIRIISARRANDKEIKAYGDRSPQNRPA
ncbi:MAG TPA: BrnT family toxin [Beijerinckiaceae bacterium]|jgi:uncharacterized DUF497 family protein